MAIVVPSVGDPITAAWGASVANAINTEVLGSSTTGAAVTLSTTSAFASTCSVTFTLAVQTRVRIDVSCVYAVTTATFGRYLGRAAYNSGSSPVIGSAIGVGNTAATAFTATGAGGGGIVTFGDALLAAGQWTAYMSTTRAVGGTATDTATNWYVCATALGFT